jgi:putative transposase
MGRPIRPLAPGAIYHVYARGNRRDLIFRVDYDYARFLRFIGDEVEFRGWNCLACCLMPNHYHLVLETPEPNLSEGMHRLNLRWAKWFNREYNLRGHVFEARFGSEVIEDDAYLTRAIRYVIRNPVDAGLCRSARDWPWSSYAEMMGAAPPQWIVNAERLSELLGAPITELAPRLAVLVGDVPNGRPAYLARARYADGER